MLISMPMLKTGLPVTRYQTSGALFQFFIMFCVHWLTLLSYADGILQVEYARCLFIGKEFSITAPLYCDLQYPLSFTLAEKVLKLAQVAVFFCPVPWPIIKHPADMRGQGHVPDQVLGENLFSAQDIGLNVRRSRWCQLGIPSLHMSKRKYVECFQKREVKWMETFGHHDCL